MQLTPDIELVELKQHSTCGWIYNYFDHPTVPLWQTDFPLLNATNYQPLSVWSAVAQLVRCSSLHLPLICKFQLFCLLSGFERLWISRFVLSNGKLDLLFQLADHFLQTKTVSTLLEKTPSFVRRSFPRKSEKTSSYNPKKMWSTEQDEWKGWLCALAHENLPAGKATKRHHGNNVILAAVLPVVTLLVVVLLDNVYLCICSHSGKI